MIVFFLSLKRAKARQSHPPCHLVHLVTAARKSHGFILFLPPVCEGGSDPCEAPVLPGSLLHFPPTFSPSLLGGRSSSSGSGRSSSNNRSSGIGGGSRSSSGSGRSRNGVQQVVSCLFLVGSLLLGSLGSLKVLLGNALLGSLLGVGRGGLLVRLPVAHARVRFCPGGAEKRGGALLVR